MPPAIARPRARARLHGPMSFLPRASLRAGVALSALVVGTACVDRATAPSAALSASGAGSQNAAAAGRIPNTVRYSDRGAKPATGRSGSAALSALALLGRDGRTELEVVSSSIAAPGVPAGEISKLQVKQISHDGVLLSTVNSRPAASVVVEEIPGLAAGTIVQVQGNIRGIDRSRTDVVTVRTTVLRRPDLGVAGLLVPSAAVAGIPVVISATVSELNGQVGARGSCDLLVDGALVDAAPGIWVDAGDAVSCAFSYAFPEAPGTKQVTVRVSGVTPRDDDPTNNSASASVVVTVERHDAFDYYAYAFDYLVTSRDSSYALIRNSDGPIYESYSSRRWTSRGQGADFFGTMAREVAFPITQLDLSQGTGGSAIHSVSLANVASTYSSGVAQCAGGDLAAGYSYAVCSGAGATDLRYFRRAGAVTYLSTYYARDWYRDASGVFYYIANGSTTSDAGASGSSLVTYGADYGFDVRLDDRGWIYIKELSIPVPAPVRSTRVQPWQCTSWTSAGSMLTSCGELDEVTDMTTAVAQGVAIP